MNQKLLPAKFRASAVHLALSLLLFFIIVALLYFCLYPSFHFVMSGGVQGLGIMFFVDVVLGPVLTFVIFNPNKSQREIILDLGLVAAVQISALIYGAYTVYQERPAVVVAYETGSAVAIPYRDTFLRPKLREALEGENLFKMNGIPLLMYRYEKGKESYQHPLSLSQSEKDMIVSHNLMQLTDKEASALPLKDYHLFHFYSKYKGAFLLLDLNYQYQSHFREEDML